MPIYDAILGLDIGTTSTKAVLFDPSGPGPSGQSPSGSGIELATAERPYRLHTPRPGWIEQDPEELWQAVVGVLRAIVDQVGEQRRIGALALAAQSGSLIPARWDGRPVYPAITWLDGRAKALVEEWRVAGIEEQVKQISGWRLVPGLCLPAIAWLRQYLPGVFGDAERYLSVNDFLVHRLTGRFCTNPSNGGGMQLLDVATGQWSQELCALAGIEPNQLSPVRPSGEVIGEISDQVSGLTGLPAATLVVNGGHDQGCTALGLGVTSPGKVVLACGTAWVVTAVVDTPDVAAMPEGLNMNFHPTPGRWTVSQSLGGLGASLEWLMNQCWRGADPPSPAQRAGMFAALDSELRQTVPGGEGLFFFPLAGGHGCPVGDQQGGFLGLRLDHTRADMARAVMEGAAFELRWALNELQRAGTPVERLWMIGGTTRSPVWPGIVADVAGVPLSVPLHEHLPAVGAAILAGVGSGAFETMVTGQACFQRPARQIEPDRTRMSIYDQSYSTYQRLGGTMMLNREGESEINAIGGS